MAKYSRIFAIVIDSVGIGFAPDSQTFGDVGANTLRSVTSFYKGNLQIPNLEKLGISNIVSEYPLTGIKVMKDPMGYHGKMYEISSGKDSMDGHFEMMGLPVIEPLGYFPNGFDDKLLKKIRDFSGRGIIEAANKPYSGTEVIKDFGEEQLKTGDLIIYTSGDSVLQIAANTAVIPLEELYKISEYVRSQTIDDYKIGRIIARPFVGDNANNFERTSDRHDYAITPYDKTDLDFLQMAKVPTFGVGKINDIFSGIGLDAGVHTKSNEDGMNQVIAKAKSDFVGFCFANLVDFDAKYGHRRDPEGFGRELELFDRKLGELFAILKDDDLVLITADHGNDPMFQGTDHTREFVPLLAYSKSMKGSGNLGVRSPFADLGATINDNFGAKSTGIGRSFLEQLN